jgi:hypothetical protein
VRPDFVELLLTSGFGIDSWPPFGLPFAASRGWFVQAGLAGALGFRPLWGRDLRPSVVGGDFPVAAAAADPFLPSRFEEELEVRILFGLCAQSLGLPGIWGLGDKLCFPHARSRDLWGGRRDLAFSGDDRLSVLCGGAGGRVGMAPSSLLWLARTSVCRMWHLRKHHKASTTAGHDDVHGLHFSPWRHGHDAHSIVDCLLPACTICCL